jgi:hypothetical protein
MLLLCTLKSRIALMPSSRGPDRSDSSSAAAKLAVAGMPRAPGSGDRVELRLILVLDREVAERLTARAISEEKNLGQLVTEIVEAAATA